MAKERQKPYEFLSNLVLGLMSMDDGFTNKFFMDEFPVSEKTLCDMRCGKDKPVYQYVRLIRCMMEYIHLVILTDVLQKQLREVLASHSDLVIATIPRRSHGAGQPEKWVVIMQWDGVIL